MNNVRSIMQTEVVTIDPGASVRELVRLLGEHEVSGVPVVDGAGRVVGVVSQTDVVRLAAHEAEISLAEMFWAEPDEPAADEDWPDSFFVAAGVRSMVPLPSLSPLPERAFDDHTVDQIMTPVAFSVDPDMSVPDLARYMVSGRIHRAVVVEGDRLVGIATAFDVLRSVAQEGEG